MTIELADWHDILQVLHETYRIWSPGLTKAAHQQYVWEQMSHPWSKNHYRYLVYKRNSTVAASCKTYALSMTARGREYRILGIGSVYTQQAWRGTGCATDMLHDVIESARAQKYEGLLLYSEIGPDFYERFGFEELGGADFCIFTASAGQHTAPLAADTLSPLTPPVPLEFEHIAWMVRHHARWLRREPYGCVRSEQYWHYKLTKEKFLQRHSHLSWPTLQLIALPGNDCNSGYMIVEKGGTTLRLLEAVGSQEARLKLWRNLLHLSVASGCNRLRGWESGIKILAPRFSLLAVLPDGISESHFEPVEYTERDWGQGMLLALNADLESWPDQFPCPLLELDHF